MVVLEIKGIHRWIHTKYCFSYCIQQQLNNRKPKTDTAVVTAHACGDLQFSSAHASVGCSLSYHVFITMCSWQAERRTGGSRLQWNDFCYSRRNKCKQNAKLLISHYFWCLMLEFGHVLVCCSFHSCDSHPSTSLQLRGVRVQSISLKCVSGNI